MRIYLNLSMIVLVITLYFSSCKNDNNKPYETLSKDIAFLNEIAGSDSVAELGSVIDVERWSIDGNDLLCYGLNADTVLYRFDGKTFEIKDTFGVRGQGPKELLMPTIVVSSQGDPMVFDNGTKTLYSIKGVDFVKKREIQEENINLPFVIGENHIGFVKLQGDNRVLLIKDIRSGTTTDSVCLTRDGIEDENIVNEVHCSAYNNHFVIGREFMDQIVVGEIDGNGTIKDIKRYEGKGHLSPTQPYYVDVDCGENNFYLLSMGKMDFSDMDNPKGAPEIQIYDYNGKPQMKYVLDFFPRKMLVDEKRNRLLILSAEDDNVHILKLE